MQMKGIEEMKGACMLDLIGSCGGTGGGGVSKLYSVADFVLGIRCLPDNKMFSR